MFKNQEIISAISATLCPYKELHTKVLLELKKYESNQKVYFGPDIPSMFVNDNSPAAAAAPLSKTVNT